MVCQHHSRDVWLTAFILSWVSTAAHGADDPARAIMTDATRGNCTSCHVIPNLGIPPDALGNIGPPLTEVGSRLTPAQIRARIVDARQLVPETIMPAYGSTTGLYRVQAAYRDKPILTNREIDVLVVYLSTLK